MATLDNLNALVQQKLDALPPGALAPASGVLPTTPVPTLDHSTPSVFEQLRALRASAQPAPTPPQTVAGRRNQHWREVAEYETWAFPLFLYLEHKDWQRVVAQHEEKWQQAFLQGLRYQMREHGGRYVGRKIRRDDVLPGTTYRIKLALPIPVPAEYARRKLSEGRDLYRQALAERAALDQREATDPRQLLADELRRAAIHLGRYEQERGRNEKTWRPDWELERVFKPETRRLRGILYPSELGKLLALVERFWQSWQAFHEAEKPANGNSSTDELAVDVPSAPTASLAHLHPTIQQAAGTLYATGHYRQALLDAFIAVDTAVREKSQLTGSGTRLMETAFSPGNPVLKIGDSPDEQQGFLSLFRGAMLAIRNPKAHSLGGTHDAQRALEWLSFASVLLRNLDEATLFHPPASL